MKLILTFCTLLLLSGCATYIQNRNVARQHNYNNLYRDELAKDCYTFFPVKDSVGKLIFTPANNIDYSAKIDSLELLVRTLNTLVDTKPGTAPIGDNRADLTITIAQLQQKIAAFKSAYKPCKPDIAIKPIYRVDMALVNVWRSKYNGAHDSLVTVQTQYTTVDKKANLYFWILAGIAGIVLVYLGIKTYIFFTGGAVANTAGNILRKL